MVVDHGHPRLVGLRYAPLVRETHRPLLLRFLVEQSVEVDTLRLREPMKVVHMKPPGFMGPPSKAPLGAMAKPPSTLPEPLQLVATIDAGNGMVGFARPLSMAPPKGAPSGMLPGGMPPGGMPPGGMPSCEGAPSKPQRPSESSALVSREMVAPQQLATMSQLLRRIATATDQLHFGRTLKDSGPSSLAPRDGGEDEAGEEQGGSAAPVDLGALVKAAARKSKADKAGGAAAPAASSPPSRGKQPKGKSGSKQKLSQPPDDMDWLNM